MTVNELRKKLKGLGIEIPLHTLRRRIDRYVELPTRGQRNNYRDLTNEEVNRMLVAVSIETLGKSSDEVVDYVDGRIDKVKLLGDVVNSSKVAVFLKSWILG